MSKPTRETRILTLLFFGPPVLVALAVLGPWELDWLPRAEQPYGHRYHPPVALPATSLQGPEDGAAGPDWAEGRFSLIYASLAPCDQACLAGLDLLRRVRRSLPADRELVQRVYLHGGGTGALGSEKALTANLLMGRIDGPTAAELRRVLGEDRLAAGGIYIADPAGKLVLTYPPDAQLEGIVRDLQRLLIISRVV